MQRSIKFRAWDKNSRYMSQVTTLDIEMGGCEQYSKNDKFRAIKPLTDVELMQCTGLKDKNGKEIYEGDILRTHLGNIGAVEHSNSVCWHIVYNLKNNPNINKNYRYDKENKIQQIWEMCRYDTCEIIGNIYENPELLEQ